MKPVTAGAEADATSYVCLAFAPINPTQKPDIDILLQHLFCNRDRLGLYAEIQIMFWTVELQIKYCTV